MNGKPWSRDEDLAVLYLKETHRAQLQLAHSTIAQLASGTNRSRDAIWMRKRNFDSLDPSVPGRVRAESQSGQRRLPSGQRCCSNHCSAVVSVGNRSRSSISESE